MGEILIGGTAALLICIFLSPKFISFLRIREFGQNIREEGPEGHHEKAGTPTMGGIIIFTAVSVPFLILTEYDWRAIGVFGVAIVLLSYIGICYRTGQMDLAMLAACLVGACIGFLWFNAFPATIFMGDTGSLGLGGAIAGLAVVTKTELLLVLLGGIFVVEALSVLIQVFSFQAFRRRVFLMAPIHHHFELMAWSETKIILRFWIIAAICSAIGFTLYQQSV